MVEATSRLDITWNVRDQRLALGSNPVDNCGLDTLGVVFPSTVYAFLNLLEYSRGHRQVVRVVLTKSVMSTTCSSDASIS